MRAVIDTSALKSFMVAAYEVSTGALDTVTAWVEYEHRHGDLFDRYFDGWGDAERRPAAAVAMVQTAESLAASGLDWDGLLDDVAARMTALVLRS